MLRAEHQSALISKITKDGLTRSGSGLGMLYSYTHMATENVKALNN